MRIKLINPKLFVDEILDEQDSSLKQFVDKLKFNYSNLKQYRRGEKLFPEDVFYELLNFSPRKNFWSNNIEKFNDNWGAIKGGKASMNGKDKLKRLIHMRSFRKIPSVNIKLNRFFCEFYGALLGDGCISKFKDYEGKERYIIQFSGNKKLDSEYFRYLKQKLTDGYQIFVYYYEVKDKNVCTLSIKNKGLCLNLNQNLDVPIGVKYNKLCISNKIVNLPWPIKKFVFRGLFDTDGCVVANKREKYKYPWVVITSKSKSFREQLIKMLREQNYPAYNTGSDVCVRGIANLKRWFSDIGSSNSRNIKKYQYFLKHGFLPARLLGS